MNAFDISMARSPRKLKLIIVSAIELDLGQGTMYAEGFELTGVLGRVSYAKSNLKQWMKTQPKPTPFPVNLNMPVHSELTPYPRGVALIITPWNLPITLTLAPLMNANADISVH